MNWNPDRPFAVNRNRFESTRRRYEAGRAHRLGERPRVSFRTIYNTGRWLYQGGKAIYKLWSSRSQSPPQKKKKMADGTPTRGRKKVRTRIPKSMATPRKSKSRSRSVKAITMGERSASRASSKSNSLAASGTGPAGPAHTVVIRSSKKSKGRLTQGNVQATAKSKRKMEGLALKGVVGTYEYTALASDSDCVYVGHSTVPLEPAMYQVCFALYKALFQKIGIRATASDLNCPPEMAGSKFEFLEARYNDNSTAVFHSRVILVTDTIDVLVSLLVTALKVWLGDGGQFRYLFLAKFIADKRVVEVDLTKAKITMMSESTFKIQNQSLNVVGETVEEVDNVPLIGKSYKIRGQAIQIHGQPKGFAVYNMTVSNIKGIVAYAASSDPTGKFKEPLLKGSVVGCTAYNDVAIQPGEIRSSIETFQKTMTFVNFFTKLQYQFDILSSARTYNPGTQLGTTTFFALEKQLNNDDTKALTIEFEHNLRMGTVVSLKNSGFTSQYFIKG